MSLISLMSYTYGNFKANPSQNLAISHPPAPLMILAGAGTGKTATLIHRIIYLITHYKVDPQSILAITYTEKAARELKDRIVSHVGERAEKMTVSTFHSLCFNIVKEYKDSGVIPQLLEESEASFLILNRFNELGPFQSRQFPLDPARSVVESFIPFFNRTRDELILPSEQSPVDASDLELHAQYEDLKRIYPLFQKWKNEMNVVDYGDMILWAHDLLKNNPHVRKILQNKIHHIIIDEFQDNNFALNEVMGFIADTHEHITVVGDEDQVIYSFRGASIHNIQMFRKRYGTHPKYKEIALEENYRSNQEILDLANTSIKKNTDRIKKTLISHAGDIHSKPQLTFAEKPLQNLAIANEIIRLTDSGTAFHEIAVLCRTHSQASGLTAYLQSRGIPVQARFPNFFEIPLVKDLNAWCQTVGGGRYQDIGFYRLLKRYTTEKFASTYYNQFNRKEPTSRLDHALVHYQSNSFVEGMGKLCELILEIRHHPKPQSAEEVLNSILIKTSILKPYNSCYEFDDQVGLLNAGQFIRKTQEFSRRNPGANDLRQFNIFVEALMNTGGPSALYPDVIHTFNSVLVQTIHGVKGGEFPVVFIPYNRSGSFPLNYKSQKRVNRPPDDWLEYIKNTRLTEKEHHIEEERRLFYVAITRAKSQLYLFAPKRATSPFIKELPKNLMEINEMEHPQEAPKTLSKIRVLYEQHLQKAINQNQFSRAHDLTKSLERIHQIEKEETISWEGSEWEKSLQLDLKDDDQPSPPPVLYLSASSIETYISCPLKYRLGRIDTIPESQSKPQLVFGNIIHRTLQRFHDPETEASQEKLLQLMAEEWDSSGFFYSDQEEEFKQQGEEILSRYFIHFQSSPPNVIAREEKFNFKIDHIKITGAIDRIDQLDGGTHVIDYKTSNTFSSAKSSMQLAIYSLYLEQSSDTKFGGLPQKASLYFLRDEEKLQRSHSFSTDELTDKKDKIRQVANAIQNREFSPKTGRHCDWCDYKNFICPAWETS